MPNNAALAGEPIPISALQHAVYCMRQAALIHLERQWAENRLTAEGRVLHEASDEPSGRKARGVRRVTALQLASKALGIAGVADLVDFIASDKGETPFPIEIKRGKPKHHRADEVQLCAQALCLEEMTGAHVREGALFYAQTRRRTLIPFDEDLRSVTRNTIAELRELFESRQIPPAIYKSARCKACSLIDICKPKSIGRSAIAWRSKALTALVDSDPRSDPI